MAYDTPNLADQERDAFVAALLPVLLGECRKGPDNSPWCEPHDSMMLSDGSRCHYVDDRDLFADSVIEAWEGRDRGR